MSIVSILVESSCSSVSGELRFRPIDDTLSDEDWIELIQNVRGVTIDKIHKNNFITTQNVDGKWTRRNNILGAKFGSLRLLDLDGDQSQLRICLKADASADGIIAELYDGSAVIDSLQRIKVNRKRQPNSTITISESSVCEYSEEPQGQRPQPDETEEKSATLNQPVLQEPEDEPGESVEEPPVGSETQSPVTSQLFEERHRRLFDLRMKMNQARNLNKKQSQEEASRLSESVQQKKQRQLKEQRIKEQEVKRKKESEAEDPELRLLNETAEAVEEKQARANKKKPAAFGWDVFNQGSLYRAYKKRTKNVPIGVPDASAAADTEDNILNYGMAPLPSKMAIDTMVNELADTDKRRAKFSRRRQFYEDETVSYINERNRVFNKKVARFFDPYTQDLKANIERGTG